MLILVARPGFVICYIPLLNGNCCCQGGIPVKKKVVKALSDIASGGFVDSNEVHTYHYGQNAKLSRTKLF